MTRHPYRFLLAAGFPRRATGSAVPGLLPVLPAMLLAVLLVLGGCQSPIMGDSQGVDWNDAGVSLAAAHRGGRTARLRPLDLTLEPGVPFGGCIVIDPVKLGDAETGTGLIC